MKDDMSIGSIQANQTLLIQKCVQACRFQTIHSMLNSNVCTQINTCQNYTSKSDSKHSEVHPGLVDSKQYIQCLTAMFMIKLILARKTEASGLVQTKWWMNVYVLCHMSTELLNWRSRQQIHTMHTRFAVELGTVFFEVMKKTFHAKILAFNIANHKLWVCSGCTGEHTYTK